MNGIDEAGWDRAAVRRSRVGDLAVLLLSPEGRGAFRRFRNVLHDEAHRAELSRWMLFSDERRLGRARDWLASKGYRCRPRARGTAIAERQLPG